MGNVDDNYLEGKMSKPGTITVPPYRRLANRPLWALESARAVQRRDDAGVKENDLFEFRFSALQDPRLKPTIIEILRYLRLDGDIKLLAKSIRIELGDTVEHLDIPENIKGRKIYYAARLLILAGKNKEAETILAKQPLVKDSIVRILIRDPNRTVRQTACAW